MNKPIWRETHAVFKLEGITHTNVRSRICVSWDRPPDSPSSSLRPVMVQHQAQRYRRTTTNFKRLANPIPLRSHGEHLEMLFRPVYSGSWICMEKFNSENSRMNLSNPGLLKIHPTITKWADGSSTHQVVRAAGDYQLFPIVASVRMIRYQDDLSAGHGAYMMNWRFQTVSGP